MLCYTVWASRIGTIGGVSGIRGSGVVGGMSRGFWTFIFVLLTSHSTAGSICRQLSGVGCRCRCLPATGSAEAAHAARGRKPAARTSLRVWFSAAPEPQARGLEPKEHTPGVEPEEHRGAGTRQHGRGAGAAPESTGREPQAGRGHSSSSDIHYKLEVLEGYAGDSPGAAEPLPAAGGCEGGRGGGEVSSTVVGQDGWLNSRAVDYTFVATIRLVTQFTPDSKRSDDRVRDSKHTALLTSAGG